MENTQNSSQKYKVILNIHLRAQSIKRKYQAYGGATEQMLEQMHDARHKKD